MLRAEETAEQHAERLQERVELYANSLISKSALNLARSQSPYEVADNFSAEFSVGTMTFSCTFCDAKFWECEKLSTSTRLLPKFPLCCGEAKVVLPSLATPPDLLAHLLTAGDTRGRAFRYNIRAYNSALAFASLRVNLDKQLANAKRGVYTFRIHGIVHHNIEQLMPREGQAPAFAQIYIHDGTPEAEAEYRQQALGEASLPELQCLQAMLHDVNPYVSFFRQGIAVMREHGGAVVRMTIRADGLSDPRRYNAPTAPEIAVIMPGDGYNEQEASRDIVLHARSGDLQRITETHRAYDPLHCVLLFLEVSTADSLRLLLLCTVFTACLR